MRILFLGTPSFAAVILGHLLASRHEIVGVVTQPPRPRGRGLKLVDPPAAALAREREIPVFQRKALHSTRSLEELGELGAELFVTAAFGRILKPRLLALPSRGCWNVHTSLLPRHRGAAPATSAILAGDLWTGVSVFELDEGMDTGPLLRQRMTPIGATETAGELTDRLAEMGGELLVRTLDEAANGPLPSVPQPTWGASYARLLEKEDGRIAWNRPARLVDRQVRALTPWPGAFTFRNGKRIRVHQLEPVHEIAQSAAPGTVLSLEGGVVVATLPGAVRIIEVQQEGKKRQPAPEWCRGARLECGEQFDSSEAE